MHRMTLRTGARDTKSVRTISLMERSCSKSAPRISPILSTTIIPSSPSQPTEAKGKDADTQRQRGSLLNAKIAPQGVIIASEFTQIAFAKHQSWPMAKPLLLAALICAAPVCSSSAQDVKVSVDMMEIGGMSCAHWQSTQAHRSEGTVWIYGFRTGLNYVASASEQTATKVDTAAIVVEVKKT